MSHVLLKGIVCLTSLAGLLPGQAAQSASAVEPAQGAQSAASTSAKPGRIVDAHNSYNRVIAVVPIIGQGTAADPKRPKYAPWPPATGQSPADIIGFSHVSSDNGQFAIVEFVARDRSAFEAILADKSITVFEKGKDRPRDIEAALQKHRKDFTFEKYGMAFH